MRTSERELLSTCAEETEAFGKQFGEELRPGSIIAFFGDLGAGKTTFIKGLVLGAAELSPIQVSSPTFTYLNIYSGLKTIYHFDLYRLKNEEQFLSLGFQEFLDAGGICCIEWSERISSLLPSNIISVWMEHDGEERRRIRIFDERGS
jgi:tRNA threonylcarbamoyladenosine biosynthesis protein TsaE